ncbi:hypothetical protein [Acidisphaera sp. S103]|uniref:hypothetical protein n=1 Tax=Acidisphaera sp. S103 TaxID=1747223 RepID=UPI00352D6B48
MTTQQPVNGFDRRCGISNNVILSEGRNPAGSLSYALAPFLPALQRWACSLSGSGRAGDAYVRATLSCILTGDRTLIDRKSPRVSLY